MKEAVEKFIAELEQSLASSTFVKLTLGNYKGSDEHLQKIFVRIVETKKGERLMFQFRSDNRDTVKNFDIAEGCESIRKYLESGFRSDHLFTTTNDFQLVIGKKNAKLTKGKPTFENKPSTSHNREKKYRIDPNAYYLKALGITTDDGKIKAGQRDKWTQINKFIEVLDGLYKKSDLTNKPNLKIVDMGSGKGYLTFAMYYYFGGARTLLSAYSVSTASVNERAEMQKPARSKGETRNIEMTGIDNRPELIDLCNEIAQAGNFDGLRFVQSTIADFDSSDIDILIALHACDNATDDALYKGIEANASIIVAAPCCHHEIKKQMKPPELLAGILKHSVLFERTAETITDGLRSLLLEQHGYKTKMFEFVATEHTPKNNLLVAVKQNRKVNSSVIEQQIAAIKDSFGIREHRLGKLLT
ncbi:MAG: class I SAM-dependent methyltransferase [Pyrinomonadaceae bacterium]